MWNLTHKKEQESQKALVDAEKNLKEVKARNPEVRRAVRKLKLLREHNHFAEQLQVIMGGHQ